MGRLTLQGTQGKENDFVKLYRDALEQLLASGAENPVPWYGQLMTTPQTIAWFLQLNHWLQTYKVELV